MTQVVCDKCGYTEKLTVGSLTFPDHFHIIKIIEPYGGEATDTYERLDLCDNCKGKLLVNIKEFLGFAFNAITELWEKTEGPKV